MDFIKLGSLNLKAQRVFYANDVKYVLNCSLWRCGFRDIPEMTCFKLIRCSYSSVQSELSKQKFKHIPTWINQSKQLDLPPPKFILKNTEVTSNIPSLENSNDSVCLFLNICRIKTKKKNSVYGGALKRRLYIITMDLDYWG